MSANQPPAESNNINRLLRNYYEIGPIRPPSEGGSLSLLLRVTRNCPWNRCGFCYGASYNHARFELRPVEDVKEDIDAVKAIADELKALSWKSGYGGRVEPLGNFIQAQLFAGRELDAKGMESIQCVVNVFNWLCAGGRTVFLQDADTPIMRTDQLLAVLDYLKDTFPGTERITSYARSKTIVHKTPEELDRLRRAGLSRLHVGLETGDDELLEYVAKGVTADEHIRAGKKAIAAGFEYSVYVMPGLGGRARSQQHAVNTARVLSEINPHFIRMRPFVPKANTPMLDAYRRGDYELTSPHERLREIATLVENLNVTSRVCFDHALNASCWNGSRMVPLLRQDYQGYKFPEAKAEVLALLQSGLQMNESVMLDARQLAGASNF